MFDGKPELLGYLSVIRDPRIDRSKLHKLGDILFITVCAVLCGCDTWEDIYEFGEIREPWLRQYLELPYGIPSVDTIARVFSLICPEEFECAFRNWVSSLYCTEGERIIAIDGKRLRGTYDNTQGKAAIHLVSAFATEQGLTLAQVKTGDKSNEITAIPELLDALILKGCIVTLDAMGCQKTIVEKIIERKGDYVISLKGNQGQLHGDIKLFLETEKTKDFKDTPHAYYESLEKGHGRIETRRYWISSHISWLENKADWAGLKSIGMVESERDIQGVVSRETRFFISSIAPDGKRFAHAVRQHWAIENNLHWQLDVSFDEDKLRARVRYAAQNLAIVRRMILNVLKQDTTKKTSLKTKRKCAGWSEAYLTKMLATLFKF